MPRPPRPPPNGQLGRLRTQGESVAVAEQVGEEHTRHQALAFVQGLTVRRGGDPLDLPPATLRNLEPARTLHGEKTPPR
jgi:hypothetical protein